MGNTGLITKINDGSRRSSRTARGQQFEPNAPVPAEFKSNA
jgi:hypothetical protein